jgi:hypothetical protein
VPTDLLALGEVQELDCAGKRRRHRKTSACRARRPEAVIISTLLLFLFCSVSALADTFGLGTAGPGDWGVLGTANGEVSFGGGTPSSPSGISVNPGASANQANFGINGGGHLTSEAATVINGTYYKHTGNNSDSISGTNIVGGTISSSVGDIKLRQAATDANNASTALAKLPPTQTPPNLDLPSSNVTIPGGSGRNVIDVPTIDLGNGITLTFLGPASSSFVVNVIGNGGGGGITLDAAKILLSGGLTAANVIFNVTGNAPVLVSGNGVVINGIVMDLHGNEKLDGATVNGEIILSGDISMVNGGDVEVVPVVPEPSAAAYFTLGPLTLIAVMLLHSYFSGRSKRRYKQLCCAGLNFSRTETAHRPFRIRTSYGLMLLFIMSLSHSPRHDR